MAQIAKSLVFKGGISGVSRVSEKALAALAGEPVTRPDADFVREQTSFAIGGVPPADHARSLTNYIDQDLLRLDVIWASAGTPRWACRLTPDELIRMTGGQVARITITPQTPDGAAI